MPEVAGGLTLGVPCPLDSSPSDVLAAMSSLPLDHPARPALRNRTVEAWLPLAVRLAQRYRRPGQPTDDLIQTAAVGLIKAVDRFDPDRKTNFVGYAIPTILGEIRRYFRDRSWDVRVPRRIQEMRLAINASHGLLTQELGRSPAVADIAAHLGTTEEQVLGGMEGALAYTATSLSTPVGHEGCRELGDTLGANDQKYEMVEGRASLKRAMSLLEERDQTILILRFYGNHTQAEIAGRLGISQMHVSRLLTRSLGRLRRALAPEHG